MEKIIIQGGNALEGVVKVGGSKNDALAILVGALAVPGITILHNVPVNSDIYNLLEIFTHLGVKYRFPMTGTLELDASYIHTTHAPQDLVSKMRASFNLLGALLARFGEAQVAMPGGCNIGARPVNFHIKGLEQLGCRLTLEHGVYHGVMERRHGANISLEFPSAGATQHLMIVAALAPGKTLIENGAMEPEIVNMANFLNACGARISGAGTSVIEIEGVDRLHPTEFSIIPDRLQAGTYAVAAAITKGDVYIKNAVYDHCRPYLAKMIDANVAVQRYDDGIRVRGRQARIEATNIKTMPHPGFPTDMQAIFAAMLAVADGVSVITESVYESRYRYTTELAKMGADIQVEGSAAIITGTPQLSGAPVTCTDLRGGAALVVAGLAAQGETQIDTLHHIDRGYENFEENLRQLGANIQRVKVSAEGSLTLV